MLQIFTLVILAACAHASRFSWEKVKYVYAFGDSYSYVQGTNGHVNYSFIGDMLDTSFTPEVLHSTEIMAKRTSSGGANWLEFLTGCHSGLPSSCSRQLWDFAFAGSNIDQLLLPLHHDYTVPLVDQVEQFTTYALPYLPKAHPQQALVAWWIGINDTGDTVNNSTITDWDAFWDSEMDSYFRAVNKLDSLLPGACHLFLSVPPGQRSPNTLNNSTKAAIQIERISSFNQRLYKRVANLKTCARIFDANKWFNNVLDNYEAFGFTNVTKGGGLQEGYFWYDNGHPTEAVHKLLAKAVEKQLS